MAEDRETTDAADELAREMYAAYLQVSEGFGPDGASKIARSQCPENYYDDAEFLLAQAGPTTDGVASESWEPVVGQRIEWNSTGDVWEPAVVARPFGIDRVEIELDDNRQILIVECRHCRTSWR